MELDQSAVGTVSNPAPVAVADGQGQLRSDAPLVRGRAWRFTRADAMMALTSLGVSFGVIAAVILALAPGAAILGAVAFWHASLTLFWLTSLAISLGTSLALLVALWIFCGFDGGRSVAVFVVLALCALVGFVAVYDWKPELFTALVRHLTN